MSTAGTSCYYRPLTPGYSCSCRFCFWAYGSHLFDLTTIPLYRSTLIAAHGRYGHERQTIVNTAEMRRWPHRRRLSDQWCRTPNEKAGEAARKQSIHTAMLALIPIATITGSPTRLFMPSSATATTVATTLSRISTAKPVTGSFPSGATPRSMVSKRQPLAWPKCCTPSPKGSVHTVRRGSSICRKGLFGVGSLEPACIRGAYTSA